MPALLDTRHAWHLYHGKAHLPPDYDVVHVGMGLGMAALDMLVDAHHEVGPVLCCLGDRQVLVPVAPDTANRWSAPHSTCAEGPALTCDPRESTVCLHRFWVTQTRHAPLTDRESLFDALSLTRDRLRRPADAWRGGVCHV